MNEPTVKIEKTYTGYKAMVDDERCDFETFLEAATWVSERVGKDDGRT